MPHKALNCIWKEKGWKKGTSTDSYFWNSLDFPVTVMLILQVQTALQCISMITIINNATPPKENSQNPWILHIKKKKKGAEESYPRIWWFIIHHIKNHGNKIESPKYQLWTRKNSYRQWKQQKSIKNPPKTESWYSREA